MQDPDCKNPDEVGGRHLFWEGRLLKHGRLVEEIRYSSFVTFFQSTHHLI